MRPIRATRKPTWKERREARKAAKEARREEKRKSFRRYFWEQHGDDIIANFVLMWCVLGIASGLFSPLIWFVEWDEDKPGEVLGRDAFWYFEWILPAHLITVVLLLGYIVVHHIVQRVLEDYQRYEEATQA